MKTFYLLPLKIYLQCYKIPLNKSSLLIFAKALLTNTTYDIMNFTKK